MKPSLQHTALKCPVSESALWWHTTQSPTHLDHLVELVLKRSPCAGGLGLGACAQACNDLRSRLHTHAWQRGEGPQHGDQQCTCPFQVSWIARP